MGLNAGLLRDVYSRQYLEANVVFYQAVEFTSLMTKVE